MEHRGLEFADNQVDREHVVSRVIIYVTAVDGIKGYRILYALIKIIDRSLTVR